MRDNPSHRRAPPTLPPAAQQPIQLSPYALQIPRTSPSQPQPSSAWTSDYPPPPPVPHISRPRVLSMQGPSQPRPRSAGEQHGSYGLAFPQPNVHRSSSHLQSTGRPNHHNRVDRAPLRLDPNYLQPNANFSTASFASYNSNDYGNEVIFISTPQCGWRTNHSPRVTTTTLPALRKACLTSCSCFLYYTALVITFSSRVSQTSIRGGSKAVSSGCPTRDRPRMASFGPCRSAGCIGKARSQPTIRDF
jgi:hypothetical protein